MKTIQFIRPSAFCLMALTFISSAYSADKYFGNTSDIYMSYKAWFLDEALTQQANPPTSLEDTAIFYKTKGSASYSPTVWITDVDTYVGNIIAAGSSGIINFGNQLLNQSVPLNLQVNNTLSVQICDEEGLMSFGTSFDEKEGTADIELTFGNINVGNQVYDGRTYESYSRRTTLSFSYGDSRITSSQIKVNGDVNLGGCGVENVNTEVLLDITADKMSVDGVMNIRRNG